MDDTAIFTDVLKQFLDIIQNNYPIVHDMAKTLLLAVVLLDIVLIIILPLIKGEEIVSKLVQRLIIILVISSFVIHYDYWANLVVNGGIDAGARASGNIDIINVLGDPSKLMDMPMIFFAKMMKETSILSPVISFFYLIIGIAIVLSFALIAITLIITYLEFAIAATLALLLLPFAALKPLAWIGEKVFTLLVSYSIRLMVLAFIVGIGYKIFYEMGETMIGLTDISYAQGLSYLMGSILFLMLSMKIPAMASGLFAGSPSLTAGDAGMAAGGLALATAGTVASQTAGFVKGCGSKRNVERLTVFYDVLKQHRCLIAPNGQYDINKIGQ